MIIAGIDPGSIHTGYAFVEKTDREIKVLEYGVIHNPSIHPLSQRIHRLFFELSGLLKEYKPDVVALETAFMAKYIQAAMVLGHARGAIMAAVGEHHIPLCEYAPRLIKKAVVGRGNASKAQVATLIQKHFGLSKLPSPADAADALGIVYCHLIYTGALYTSATPIAKSSGKRKIWIASELPPEYQVATETALHKNQAFNTKSLALKKTTATRTNLNEEILKQSLWNKRKKKKRFTNV